MGDSSDSDPEFDKDDPYCFDPDWEDCYALASDVQGGPDEQSSSDEEDKAGDGSGATNDAEPVCVCQNCRYQSLCFFPHCFIRTVIIRYKLCPV
jgi:hypothetical protein